MDRVTFELNQHLNEVEENVKVKAARLVSFIEGEVSEYS